MEAISNRIRASTRDMKYTANEKKEREIIKFVESEKSSALQSSFYFFRSNMIPQRKSVHGRAHIQNIRKPNIPNAGHTIASLRQNEHTMQATGKPRKFTQQPFVCSTCVFFFLIFLI